jgi:hypothetical protein
MHQYFEIAYITQTRSAKGNQSHGNPKVTATTKVAWKIPTHFLSHAKTLVSLNYFYPVGMYSGILVILTSIKFDENLIDISQVDTQ